MMCLFACCHALPIESAPEAEHAVEHLPRMRDEDVVVDIAAAQDVLDLVVRMLRVITFELRMPGEKADVERFESPSPPKVAPAVDELVPEAGRRPVLDGPRRRGRDRVVLVPVKADQLVAEVQRRRCAEAALAEVAKAEPELSGHAHEQLEMRRTEAERAAVDRAFGIAELVLGKIVPGTIFRGEADADLVREDLFRLAHLRHRVGVQHLQELRDEKLIGENRELLHECAGVCVVELAATEPRGVRVRDDDRMAEHVALESCLEPYCSFVHHEPPEADEPYSSARCVGHLANSRRGRRQSWWITAVATV